MPIAQAGGRLPCGGDSTTDAFKLGGKARRAQSMLALPGSTNHHHNGRRAIPAGGALAPSSESEHRDPCRCHLPAVKPPAPTGSSRALRRPWLGCLSIGWGVKLRWWPSRMPPRGATSTSTRRWPSSLGARRPRSWRMPTPSWSIRPWPPPGALPTRRRWPRIRRWAPSIASSGPARGMISWCCAWLSRSRTVRAGCAACGSISRRNARRKLSCARRWSSLNGSNGPTRSCASSCRIRACAMRPPGYTRGRSSRISCAARSICRRASIASSRWC